jgi:hypothetical protein
MAVKNYDSRVSGVELMALYGEDSRVGFSMPSMERFKRRAEKIIPSMQQQPKTQQKKKLFLKTYRKPEKPGNMATQREMMFRRFCRGNLSGSQIGQETGVNPEVVEILGQDATPEVIEVLGAVADGRLSLSEAERLGAFLPGLTKAFKKVTKAVSNTIAKLDPTSSTAPLGKIIKTGLSVGANLILPGSGVLVSKGLSAAHEVGANLKAKGKTPGEIFTELQSAGFDPATATKAIQEIEYVAPKSPAMQTLTNPMFLIPAGLGAIGLIVLLTRKPARPYYPPPRY